MSKRLTEARKLRNDPTIGENIQRFRTAAGISQTDLGNKTGVTFQQIQKYEKGGNACPPGRLRRICLVLNVTVAEMFGEPPQVDGEKVPLNTERAHRVLIALGKIRDDQVKRALEALIEELAPGQ